MKEYSVIVIGAGPGGYEAAAIAASQGLNVLIIEKDLLGGTCLNRGCIPTKALCRSAQVAADIAESAGFGICTDTDFSVDLAKMVERKHRITTQLREGVASMLAKCDVVKGEARFQGEREIEVDGQVYTAPKVVIATGSVPAVLPIPGADLCVNSDAMLSLEKLPESLVVIGGGVIGMEFASIFNAFGTKVTVVEYCREILPPFDKDIAKRLRTAMSRKGVDFFTSSQVTEVKEDAGGMRTVCFEAKGKPQTVTAQMVLMAVGRRPVIPAGAEDLGLETSRGAIVTTPEYLTTIEGVYAIGDCNGRCMLAHAASAQARKVMGEDVDMNVIPSAVFTMPECAMVGLTEEQCKEKALLYKVSKGLFRGNGKALAMDETDGLVKLITSTAPDNEGAILGCHIMGPHAADLIAEVALAMSAGLPVQAIASAVHSHPTLSEAVAAAAAQA